MIVVLILAIAGFAWHKFSGGSSSSFDVASLPVSAFVDNSNSLRGNDYQIEGKVDDQIYWNSDGAQMISLLVEENGKKEYVPIQIPKDYEGGNITRERRYRFKVQITEGGIPKAIAIEAM